ncbi:MAG: hypothetical protein LBV20_02400 [Treponema sp.]|jgi:tetratricopeptide (TPR) repeat protein|nr:hypothetical protein [Treponema sp.]
MKHFSLIIIILFVQSFLFSQSNIKQPRLDPDEKAFEFAHIGQTRDYSWQDMLDIALWASGADYSKDNTVRNSILASGEILAKSKDLPQQKNDQGEFILNYMHQTFLKKYEEKQTLLDVLVNTGRYNCVSSAVLYAIFASVIGLETNGILTKDHAFIQVNIGTELVDVETTTLYGYNPGIKKEFHDGFGNTTGYAYVAPRNYRDRSPISQLELMSLILSNRIVDLESRGFFADAVGIAIDKAALMSARRNPSESSFFTDPNKDVMDRLFNYGASLIQAGKEEDALSWADAAESRYPDNRWQDFVFAAANNHLVKMIRTKKISDARVFLDMEASRFSSANYAKLELLVSDAELVQITSLVSTAVGTEQALQKIAQIESRGIISADRIAEVRSFVLLKEAERRAKNSGWKDAAIYMEHAIDTYGSNTQLKNALKVFKDNIAIDYHNEFADLFNAGEYEEALRVMQKALQEFPSNRQLTSDLRMVENAMERE